MVSTILNLLIFFNKKQIIAVIRLHVVHILCASFSVFEHKYTENKCFNIVNMKLNRNYKITAKSE